MTEAIPCADERLHDGDGEIGQCNVADPASPATLAEIGAHLDQLIAMDAELATS